MWPALCEEAAGGWGPTSGLQAPTVWRGGLSCAFQFCVSFFLLVKVSVKLITNYDYYKYIGICI